MRFSRKIFILIIAVVVFGIVLNIGYNFIMKRLYPMKYSEFVQPYSEENNLDPMFVYAVIKCESNFRPDAVSTADAKGLMQLTDDTFAWVQTKAAENKNLEPENLFVPNTNIKYGTLLLSLHIEEFESKELALAAYHAGRGIVNKWINEGTLTKQAEGMQRVPYEETNVYIKRVLDAMETYEKLYK